MLPWVENMLDFFVGFIGKHEIRVVFLSCCFHPTLPPSKKNRTSNGMFSQWSFNLPSLKLTARTWNTGVGSDEFPFGARPPARCELLVFGSVKRSIISSHGFGRSSRKHPKANILAPALRKKTRSNKMSKVATLCPHYDVNNAIALQSKQKIPLNDFLVSNRSNLFPADVPEIRAIATHHAGWWSPTY